MDPLSSSSSSSFLLGGSSFEVAIENEEFFSNCGVIDYFNHTYHVNCSIPLSSASTISTIPSPTPTTSTATTTTTTRLSTSGSHKTHDSHQFQINRHSSNKSSPSKRLICYNLTIILDFEHYSAFTDFKLTPVKLRNYIIDNTIICRNITKLPKTLHHVHQLHEQLRSYYMKLPPPLYPSIDHSGHSSSYSPDRDHQRMKGSLPSYHSYYYLSKERMFPNKAAIMRCFNDSHPLFMLGKCTSSMMIHDNDDDDDDGADDVITITIITIVMVRMMMMMMTIVMMIICISFLSIQSVNNLSPYVSSHRLISYEIQLRPSSL